MALGPVSEPQFQLIVAVDLRLLPQSPPLLEEVGRMRRM
jgi:hypothetical protein